MYESNSVLLGLCDLESLSSNNFRKKISKKLFSNDALGAHNPRDSSNSGVSVKWMVWFGSIYFFQQDLWNELSQVRTVRPCASIGGYSCELALLFIFLVRRVVVIGFYGTSSSCSYLCDLKGALMIICVISLFTYLFLLHLSLLWTLLLTPLFNWVCISHTISARTTTRRHS